MPLLHGWTGHHPQTLDSVASGIDKGIYIHAMSLNEAIPTIKGKVINKVKTKEINMP